MVTGRAIHIGLNSVDAAHYGGWPGELMACETDATDMASVSKSRGFQAKVFMTKDATSTNVLAELGDAANKLQSGDILLITYSGHGGQLPDKNGDELDGLDETWCLYDRQLVDDELYSMFAKFQKGVRVSVFSDSCHSGSVVKGAYYSSQMNIRTTNVDANGTRYRFLPLDLVYRTFRLNQAVYEPILTDENLVKVQVSASVMLLAACQDNQYAADGAFNGLYTSHLLAVWNHGAYQGNYSQFLDAIVANMPPTQTPNFYTIGAKSQDFENQTPFTI